MPSAHLCPPDSTGLHRTPQDLCRGWGCRMPPSSQGLPTRVPPGGTLHVFLAECSQGAGLPLEEGTVQCHEIWLRNRSRALPSGRLLSSANPGVGEAHVKATYLTSCAPSSFPHCSPFAWQGPGRYCLCPRVQRTPPREPQGSEDLGLSRLWSLGQGRTVQLRHWPSGATAASQGQSGLAYSLSFSILRGDSVR